MALKKYPKSKITLEVTRYKNDWQITSFDATKCHNELLTEFDTELGGQMDKELNKAISEVLLKYETSEGDITEREESIRKLKSRFEGN